jgi:hypothetical protein
MYLYLVSDFCTQLYQLIKEMVCTRELGAAVHHSLSHPWVT